MSKPARASDTAKAELPFEAALQKLEAFVEAMESEDLPLENLIKRYEEGVKLAQNCQAKLAEAELKISQLDRISELAKVPMVLHGGSGIRKQDIWDAIQHGIAKINIGVAIRQPYENNRAKSVKAAQDAVYETTVLTIREELKMESTAERVNPV